MICNIADNDVCFCRVMNQLAGVNIQSSVGMLTMSFHSLTCAEPFGFLLLLRNFCQIIRMLGVKIKHAQSLFVITMVDINRF